MGKTQLGLSCIVLLPVFMISPAFCSDDAAIRAGVEEIRVINLLNNLDLRRDQLEFVLARAREAETYRRELRAESACDGARLGEAVAAIQREVEAGKVTVGADDAKEWRAWRARSAKAVASFDAKMGILASQVEAKLEEFQLLAVDSYKACVIPRISGNRIGQSGSHDAIVKLLERVRRLDNAAYESRKEGLAGRAAGKLKEKLPFRAVAPEPAVRDALLASFTAVRAMDDADFMLRKEGIAAKLSEEIAGNARRRTRAGTIRRFLLSSAAIAVLEKKLR